MDLEKYPLVIADEESLSFGEVLFGVDVCSCGHRISDILSHGAHILSRTAFPLGVARKTFCSLSLVTHILVQVANISANSHRTIRACGSAAGGFYRIENIREDISYSRNTVRLDVLVDDF